MESSVSCDFISEMKISRQSIALVLKDKLKTSRREYTADEI